MAVRRAAARIRPPRESLTRTHLLDHHVLVLLRLQLLLKLDELRHGALLRLKVVKQRLVLGRHEGSDASSHVGDSSL